MPQFTTISPTHEPGKKEYAWQRFLKGGYVAIGWQHEIDLTGKSLDEIEKLLAIEYPDEPETIARASRGYERFLSLRDGDYVAVPNVNFGIFGVGIVRSGYKFKENMHDTGSEDRSQFYSHYRTVEWVVKDYREKADILLDGEKSWQPFGTIGKVHNQVPAYIARLVGISVPLTSQKPPQREALQPEFLRGLIQRIGVLRTDIAHQERDHESLVEDFFVSIGYGKQTDLKFRRGRIDLTISSQGLQLAVVEAKRTWDLDFESATEHIKQAYAYAHENGVRFVIVTNGDDYIVFDRLKGLSWESNLLCEWKLTALRAEDLEMIDRLRPDKLSRPNLAELFQNLSEAFGK
jgi:type I restriction and modification enzyme subunit R-like protein